MSHRGVGEREFLGRVKAAFLMEKNMTNLENLNKVEEFALAMAGAGVLGGEFDKGLKRAPEGAFVPKPKMLSRFDRAAREDNQWLIDMTTIFADEITRRKIEMEILVPTTSMEASDLAARSMWLEMKLAEGGAIYGDRPFNFAITDLKLPRQTVTDIQQAALTAYSTIKACLPINAFTTDTERYIDEQAFAPNGARVDIILTEDGPKIIEVNMQWVDGIQALEGFQMTYLGMPQKTVELLAGTFKGKGRLAVLDITRGAESRSSGARFELQSLALNLEGRFSFSEVEIMDPRKVLPDYLREFDGIYINGEPRMIPEGIPDWLKVVLERSARGSTFPLWRPALDRKRILVEASARSKVFVPTIPFTAENFLKAKRDFDFMVVKGDGYSSKCVGVEETPEFEGIVADAQLFPNEYVIQPRLEPVTLEPMVCLDTSSNRPIYLPQPRSKFNVWIINGKVAGVLASVSDRLVISDKDFNVVPKAI